MALLPLGNPVNRGSRYHQHWMKGPLSWRWAFLGLPRESLGSLKGGLLLGEGGLLGEGALGEPVGIWKRRFGP